MSGERFVVVLERAEADRLRERLYLAGPQDVGAVRDVLLALLKGIAGDKRLYQTPPSRRDASTALEKRR